MTKTQPILTEIDLSQADKHECPGIDAESVFLCLIDGELHTGQFSRQWYGWSFDGWRWNPAAGLQFDAPGSNSSRWERIWKIELDLPKKCLMCRRPLNVSDDPLSKDCGGDCWRCVGESKYEDMPRDKKRGFDLLVAADDWEGSAS